MVHSGHNALLTELYRGLPEVVTASVAATSNTHPDNAQEIEHRSLAKAIADRDPARAAAEAEGFLNELPAGIAD